jgi:preprotein translocase subunit SecG
MWFTVVLIIQILVIVSMILAVLLQRSEGGALGMGGGGGGGGLLTSRGAGSALTRVTGVLAGMFFICSITLTILARNMADTGLDYSIEGTAAPLETGFPNLAIPPVPIGEAGENAATASDGSEAPVPAEPDDDRPRIPE